MLWFGLTPSLLVRYLKKRNLNDGIYLWFSVIIARFVIQLAGMKVLVYVIHDDPNSPIQTLDFESYFAITLCDINEIII